MWGDWPDGVAVFGNDRLRDFPGDFARNLGRNLGELADAWDDFHGGLCAYYDTWADALADLVTPEGRPEYTRQERKKDWPDVLDTYAANGYRDDPEAIAAALTLITGRAWDYCTLRGCCQGDWQECIYDTDLWDGDSLERLEAEYFNTGTEWHVYDGDEYVGTYYATEWDDDEIRRQIAEMADVNTDDVALFRFTGWAHVAQYEEA
jgi:hypothetical protein